MEKTKRFNLTTVLMLVLILLALALAFSGNALAFADDEVAFTVTSPLSFSDSSSNTTLEYDGYTWVYDSESKKGTLTIASAGLTVEPTDSDLPITFYVDAEVVLDGDLTLKGNNDGIRAEGDLTISGANDLTINATNGDGIYASGDITINGLNELNITAVYYGIMAGKNLYISDLDTIYIDADDAGIVTDSGSI